MERNGMIDERDLTCHIAEESGKAVKVAESRFTADEGEERNLAGKQCWLQFVAFDVRLAFVPKMATNSAMLSSYSAVRCCS
jgi:hypothetical protein